MDTALGSGVADPIMNLGGVFANLHYECQLDGRLAADSRDVLVPAPSMCTIRWDRSSKRALRLLSICFE